MREREGRGRRLKKSKKETAVNGICKCEDSFKHQILNDIEDTSSQKEMCL